MLTCTPGIKSWKKNISVSVVIQVCFLYNMFHFHGNEHYSVGAWRTQNVLVPVMEKVLCSPHYERSGWPQELLHWQPLLHCWQILSGFLCARWRTLPHHQVEVICQLTWPGKDNRNLWKQIPHVHVPLFMHWLAKMMCLSYFRQRLMENNV